MQNKILILANSSSGLYDFRKELIMALEKSGKVVASVPDGDKIQNLHKIGCKIITTPIDRRGVNPVTDIKLFRNYIRILKHEKPTLVITYTIKPNVYGGFACRIMKIPYAANITGLGTAFQKTGLLQNIVTLLYKIGLKRATTVFFENMENREIFLEHKIVSEKQTCLLNGAGVNLEYFSMIEYPQDENITRFLFIGRVMREKGIEELLGAMQRLVADGEQCVLDILGDYEENYADKIKNFEAEGWLHYYGYQADVRPFIANAHCFVLPSWHEGMANTNLECAAMGRPVITSNIYGCKEAVIQDVSGILCEKQDAESLYQAMKRFLQMSREERRNMGANGRKHMEIVFDKEKVVADTMNRLF